MVCVWKITCSVYSKNLQSSILQIVYLKLENILVIEGENSKLIIVDSIKGELYITWAGKFKKGTEYWFIKYKKQEGVGVGLK